MQNTTQGDDSQAPQVSNLPRTDEVLKRHSDERAAMKKRHDKTRSGIPKKDRIGRQRFIEDARDEEENLRRAHNAELDELGYDSSQVEEALHYLKISSSSNNLKPPSPMSNSVPGEAIPPNGTRTESKAARRRRRKAELEAESQQRIMQEKMAMGPSEKAVELASINEQLNPKRLRIHPIPADGHCLYSAVAHQIEQQMALNQNYNAIVDPSVDALRHATADFLLAHKEEYMPFIESVHGDDERFISYCDDIRNTATWGGHIELQILSKILCAVIEVYAANMTALRIGAEDNDSAAREKHVLRVSYHRKFIHLGEHYNSVVPKDGDAR